MRPWLARLAGKRQLPPLPNFMILGASRAGTSTLHSWLGQHPDIFMSRPKELWHFNRDDRYRLGLDHYRARFAGWRGEPVLGECTPVYLYRNLLYQNRQELYWAHADGAVCRIARDLPDARMLISLRHPLDRFVSQYRKNSRRGKAGVGPDLETYARRTGAGGMAYRNDLENVIELLGRERIMIVIFEEWTIRPQAVLQDVCRFVGVSPEFGFDVSGTQVRTGDEGMLVQRLARRLPGPMARISGSEVMPDSLRRQLCDALADDVAFVETLLGRPVKAWRTASTTQAT
jgi:hypothetical protein